MRKVLSLSSLVLSLLMTGFTSVLRSKWYFFECTSDDLGRVICSDEVFGHCPTLVGKCFLCATDAF